MLLFSSRSLRLDTRCAKTGFGNKITQKQSKSTKPPESRTPDELYNPGLLEPFVGPVETFVSQGKGRGLRVTHGVAAGTLLLISRPAAAIRALHPGIQPQPSDLWDMIERRGKVALDGVHGSAQLTLSGLGSLFDGTTSSMNATPRLAELSQCRLGGGEENMPSTSKAVELNAYGEPWGDVAAWTCRGQGRELCGFIGVWPAMALVNHSCAPNAAAMVLASSSASQMASYLQLDTGEESLQTSGSVNRSDSVQSRSITAISARDDGDSAAEEKPCNAKQEDLKAGDLMMVVRAAKALKAGEEVTIAYTGKYTTSPLEIRREHLQTSYGFSCSCARCTAEGRLEGLPLAEALREAYKELEGSLKGEVMFAVEEEDMEEVLKLLERLHSISRSIRASVSVFGDASEATKVFMNSWIYLCYELIAICCEALEEYYSREKKGFSGSAARAGQHAEDEKQGKKHHRKTQQHGLGGAKRAARFSFGASIVRLAEIASLDSVAMRLSLLKSISPGSYQHASFSARLLSGTKRLMGKAADETQEALECCVEAHTARYGRANAATLSRLVDAHERNDLIELLSDCQL